jgi:hypothetical protein
MKFNFVTQNIPYTFETMKAKSGCMFYYFFFYKSYPGN